MPNVAFSTLSCPDWTWRDVLDNGPQYGYDGVEVRLIARETDLLKVAEFQPSEWETRRRELAGSGFAICGLSSSVRFDYPDANERRRQLETGRAYVDMAQALGAAFVRVFGDVLPKDADAAGRQAVIDQIREGLETLGEYGGRAGVDILIETHGDFVDSRLMHELIAPVESPAVGILWDTHHPWRFLGEDIAATFERLRPWVRHTHWKDSVSESRVVEDEAVRRAAQQAHSLMSGHRHADYALFGDGEFPAAECVRLLRESGYTGWLSLEWEKMWHPQIEDPEVALPPFPERIRRLW